LVRLHEVWALFRWEGALRSTRSGYIGSGEKRASKNLPNNARVETLTAVSTDAPEGAEHKDHVWSYDYFVTDHTGNGRRLKMLASSVLVHQGLAWHCARRGYIIAEDVVRTMAALSDLRGELSFIRTGSRPRVHSLCGEALASSFGI
jgi:hypothetical protein